MGLSNKPVSPELQSLILRKLSDPRTSPQDLTSLADLCSREGAVETAKALRARAAEKLPAPKPRADAAGLALPRNREPVRIEVPPKDVIPGVPHDRWMIFEKSMIKQGSAEIDSSGRLGMFGMSPKRLVDLGLVVDTAKGPNGKWAVGKWSEGWSSEKFLGDPKVQQKAFRRSMREYTRTIGALYKEALGKSVHGKPVTCSGLLSVAHMAGGRGLGSWLSNKTVREKFPQTTKVFLNATGMF